MPELTDLEWKVVEIFCAREEITVDYFIEEFFGTDVFTKDFLRSHLSLLQQRTVFKVAHSTPKRGFFIAILRV